jgi:hypothetical protein
MQAIAIQKGVGIRGVAYLSQSMLKAIHDAANKANWDLTV